MKFATVCSGINAPAQAWQSLGWEEVFCAEIEAFPCAFLKHHYPNTQNLGDITKYEEWPTLGIELLCGGTPCQSFSVAGLRKGMDDPRGQLTRAFIGIAARYRPRWLLWENVPGVLSSNDGRDFAEFPGGLTGRKVAVPAEGWRNSGILAGIEAAYGVAWRVLDAEFVRVDSHPRAVPQRRERVFLVGHLGGCWQRPAAVLLERESLRGDSAPRREAGKGFTHDVAPCIGASGRGVARPGETRGQDPVVAVAHALRAEGFDASEDGTGRGTPLVATGIPEVCGALSDGAHNGGGLNGQDAYSGRILPVVMAHGQANAEIVSDGEPSLTCNHEAPILFQPKAAVAFTQNTRDEVRLIGGDGQVVGALAAEPGMKQQAYVAFAIQERAVCENPNSGPDGIGVQQDVAYTMEARSTVQAVAFEPRYFTRDNKTGGAPSEVAAPLRSEGHAGDSAPHVMALAIRGRGDGRNLEARKDGASNAILTPNGGRDGMGVGAIATQTAVRRLTPIECERLMGMEDNYTLIPIRGKLAADGPRYKALGNSMCRNVMRWLGLRIEMVDNLVD